MKKLFIIVFLLVVFVGLIGNAAKIENDYLDNSSAALQPVSGGVFSHDSQGSIGVNQEGFLTLGLLLGTGLVGLFIIRRK